MEVLVEWGGKFYRAIVNAYGVAIIAAGTPEEKQL